MVSLMLRMSRVDYRTAPIRGGILANFGSGSVRTTQPCSAGTPDERNVASVPRLVGWWTPLRLPMEVLPGLRTDVSFTVRIFPKSIENIFQAHHVFFRLF